MSAIINPLFDTILIANRGEIACRVIRTARRLGIRTVAVYSEVDANALHVELADDAVCIGKAAAAESYLNGPLIIEAARAQGAQAIHPGYGFLSENADFARACETAGLQFIGPPATAMDAMASKSAAKLLMQQSGVPVLPGYHGDEQDDSTLQQAAESTGFPLMLKASAGGGGKGMRIVNHSKDFLDQLAAVKREALASFGDDHVLLERYVETPRHIEIQIFSDSHDNHLHLFERDCSVQRRHQKVLEEAPAPGLDEATRQKMGKAAVNAAQAVGYVGAGTVEFIADSDGSFYFMEMNTRLQVEHPVTEMIVDKDLVEWQLRIAGGDTLPCSQNDLAINGHAIEARIYAEDPARDFLPASGKLEQLQFVENHHPDIRVETGVRKGDTVSVHYDPMIAKLVAHGRTRSEAIARLSSCLQQTEIAGLATNLQYLRYLLSQTGFQQGGVTTRFIEETENKQQQLETDKPALWQNTAKVIAVVASARLHSQAHSQHNTASFTGWRINSARSASAYWLDCSNGKQYLVSVSLQESSETLPNTTQQHNPGKPCDYQVNVSSYAGEHKQNASVDQTFDVAIDSFKTGKGKDTGSYSVTAMIDRQTAAARIVCTGQHCSIYPMASTPDTLWPHDFRLQRIGMPSPGENNETSQGSLRSPMPGKVIAVNVAVGDRVTAGQTLIVVEAMKMEHAVAAPNDGTVTELCYASGDSVAERAILVKLSDTNEE